MTPWNRKYWDVLDQLYWTPTYVGMRSIPQRLWKYDGDRVSIPSESVNSTGPLYARERKADAQMHYMHGSEEALNHVFDLAFAIAPDTLIRDVIMSPLNITDGGPFDSLGREIAGRYGWPSSANVTQHDGLFVSEKSAVGVELKLLSHSWPGQVAKYIALLAWEEMVSGEKDHLGLLYIVPETSKKGLWRQCGLEGARISSGWLGQNWDRPLPRAVQTLFTKNHQHVRSVAERLRLGVISWSDLHSRLRQSQDVLDISQAGDQTLHRLLSGLLEQLKRHRGTGLD